MHGPASVCLSNPKLCEPEGVKGDGGGGGGVGGGSTGERQGEKKGGSDVHQAVFLPPVFSSCPTRLSSHVARATENIKAAGVPGHTHTHLYVGVLAADVSLGEVGEVVQIQEEGPGPVPAHGAPRRPREGGGSVGQPVLRPRPPLLRSQFGRRAALRIYTVLLERDRDRKTTCFFLFFFFGGGAEDSQ